MEAAYAAALVFLAFVFLARYIRMTEQENYRAGLFELRDRLFDLALSDDNALTFEHQAYIDMNRLVNSLLRFAHRVTFLSTFAAVREFNRMPKDIARQALNLETSRSPQSVAAEMEDIRRVMQQATSYYLVAQSPVLGCAAPVVRTLRGVLLPILKRFNGFAPTFGADLLKKATQVMIAESVREYSSVPVSA